MINSILMHQSYRRAFGGGNSGSAKLCRVSIKKMLRTLLDHMWHAVKLPSGAFLYEVFVPFSHFLTPY